MTSIDAFEHKTIFQQLSDYTIKRVQHIVNVEDIDLSEEEKRINTFQFELLDKVSNYFKDKDIGILPIESDEFILHRLLPYYLSGRKVFLVSPSRFRHGELLQSLSNKDKNEFVRLGLTSEERSKFFTYSIIPQTHVKRCDIRPYDMIICTAVECTYKTGVNNPRSFDMSIYDEDYFSLVIIDSADNYSDESWEAINKSFGKSKLLFLIDPETKLDGEKKKHLIQ